MWGQFTFGLKFSSHEIYFQKPITASEHQLSTSDSKTFIENTKSKKKPFDILISVIQEFAQNLQHQALNDILKQYMRGD